MALNALSSIVRDKFLSPLEVKRTTRTVLPPVQRLTNLIPMRSRKVKTSSKDRIVGILRKKFGSSFGFPEQNGYGGG